MHRYILYSICIQTVIAFYACIYEYERGKSAKHSAVTMIQIRGYVL